MSWKTYFDYTKSERRGIFVMVFVIILMLAAHLFFIPETEEWRMEEADRREIDNFRYSLLKREKEKKTSKKSWERKSNRQLSISAPFDPNTLHHEEWMQMGLSAKQAQVIRNYLEKGGRFYKKEDLKKMYCISDELYRQMHDYIRIENVFSEKQELYVEPEEEVPLLFDLNEASAEDLQEIRGIGPSYSNRIVKYRKLLGGYASSEQLYEVYGFDSTIVALVLQHVWVDADALSHININTCTTSQLYKHPYISKQMAYAIVSHREQSGLYKKLDDLLVLDEISQQDFQKVKPYLKLSDDVLF